MPNESYYNFVRRTAAEDLREAAEPEWSRVSKLFTIKEVVNALANWKDKGVNPLSDYLLSVGSTSKEEIQIAVDVFNELSV